LLRNYWALVAGILTGAVAANILSYVMSSYRPRFSLAKVREIWGFSIWTLVRSMAYYLNSQVDLLIIGGFASPARMGNYAVAHDLAASPTDEINGPMVAVLFPVMSTVQNDLAELRRLYLNALGWSALICASTSVGVAMVANDLVPVVLGPKWVQTIGLIPWLAMAAGVLGLSSGAFSTFDTLNMARRGARLSIVRLFMLVVVLAPVAFLTRSVGWIAVARLVVTVLFVPGLLVAVGNAVGVSVRSQFAVLWRPIFAAGVMALSIAVANLLIVNVAPVRLVADVLLGSLVYAVALLFIWNLAGRPPSPEKDAAGFMQNMMHRAMGAPLFRWSASRRNPLHVCLYVAVPRSAEGQWSLLRVRNFFWRNALLFRDGIAFCRSGKPRLDHLHYRSPSDHNKGDVLIRDAIRRQIRSSFAPRHVVFSEVGWGQLNGAAVQRINQRSALFVIAGSGYFFFDEFGALPARVAMDVEQLPKIRCPKIAYGIGWNHVIEMPADNINHLPEIAPAAMDLVRATCAQLDAISLRATQGADIIERFYDRPVYVIGDPALFSEDGCVSPRRAGSDGKRLRVGLNFAVHGRISVGNFVKNFDTICSILRQLRARRDVEFVYICHLRNDAIVPILFRLGGIAMQTRRPSAKNLADAYSDIDLNICQMMHSSILSVRLCVPTINLAYDVKNMAFFRQMNIPEYCVPMAGLDGAEVLALVEKALAEKPGLETVISESLQRLQKNADTFRAVMRALCGDAGKQPQHVQELVAAVT